MSNLLVDVTTIEQLLPHTNADSLEIAVIKGWQVVVAKGKHQVGEKMVYFPPDTVLPVEVSDRFGVTKYLSNGRIRCAKLCGEPSFGLAVTPDDLTWKVGTEVSAHYGATKYEPPLRPTAGDALPPHPLFPKYTEIENMRSYPDIFEQGEPVMLSEKIHGTSCRIGMVEGEWMAGSMEVRRAQPEREEAYRGNLYWFPYTIEPIYSLINALQAAGHRQIILYGEVYGPKVQTLHYGLSKDTLGFRAFDLLIDGKYCDWLDFLLLCSTRGVETVPHIATIPYTIDAIRAYSSGHTLLMKEGAHIREGLVVRPCRERTDMKVGRVILKYLSDDYLFGKNSDYKDV